MIVLTHSFFHISTWEGGETDRHIERERDGGKERGSERERGALGLKALPKVHRASDVLIHTTHGLLHLTEVLGQEYSSL